MKYKHMFEHLINGPMWPVEINELLRIPNGENDEDMIRIPNDGHDATISSDLMIHFGMSWYYGDEKMPLEIISLSVN